MRFSPLVQALCVSLTLLATTGSTQAASDPLTALSDEFNSPTTLTQWQLIDKVEHTTPSYSILDIAKSRPGHLTLVPKTSSWYMNDTGSLLFKTVTGDFIATAYVKTHGRTDPSSPPRNPFNSAGLIARDPNSRSGQQNWVVCNVGMQEKATGSEVKSTQNSVSQLHLENGESEGEVRIARLGDALVMMRRLKGESQWRNLGMIRRPDLGQTLQVGIMCNGYQSADLIAEIDYIRFATPAGPQDLTRDLPSTDTK